MRQRSFAAASPKIQGSARALARRALLEEPVLEELCWR
jgi:hypothetical protein